MTEMSFQEACAYLRRAVVRAIDEESDDPQVALAEAAILDHRPQEGAEAAIMIDTLIENLAAGTRTDQRDIRALTSLQAWIIQGAAHAVAA